MLPFIWISGREISVYGLLMMVAVAIVAILFIRSARSEDICFEDVLIICACALGVGLLGGWLLYVFVTYSWQQLVTWVCTGNYRFMNGGIVFYGSLFGGILGAFLGLFIAKRKLSQIVPHIVPYLPLGHAIGRVGCVMAGCCHGMAYSGPLAIYYQKAVTGLSPRQGYFPVQLLEAILNIVLSALLLFIRKRFQARTSLMYIYLLGYGLIRFATEFFRGDQVRGIFGGISTSQWISLGCIIISTPVLIYRWQIHDRSRQNNAASPRSG